MNAFIDFLMNLLGFSNKSKRLHLKDVKPGDRVVIEWYRIDGEIGTLKCINNDPVKKKILLEVKWGNYKESKINETELIICDYNDKRLKNYHLLNSQNKPAELTEIEKLEQELNLALEAEDFEKAAILQTQLNKLKDEH